MKKKEKGITLIALVITVILLLILAGVTIRWVTTGDSIFKYADIAKKETKRGEIIEYLDLTLVDEQTEGYKETVETIIKNTQKRVKANGKSDLSAIAKEVETKEVETKKYNEKDAEYYFYVVVDEEVYKVGLNGTEYLGKRANKEVVLQEGEISFDYSETKLTNENVKVTITANTNIEGAKLYYKTKGEKGVAEEESNKWKEYNGEIEIEKNCSIVARLEGIMGDVTKEATGNVQNIDKLEPKTFTPSGDATTNTITVTANAEDHEKTEEYATSGIAGYSFSIDGENWSDYKEEGIYTFDKLTQSKPYTIKVKAKDKVGNEMSTPVEITVNTKAMVSAKEEGYITFEGLPKDLTNKNVTVTAKTTSGYTIQTSTDKTNWEDKASQELEKNGKVYARLLDSTGQYAEGESWATAEVTKIDKLEPKTFTPGKSSTTNTITVTANTEDHEKTNDYATSGIAGYSFSIDGGEWTTYQEKGEYTFSNLKQSTEHTIKVKAKDKVGNEMSTPAETTVSTKAMVAATTGTGGNITFSGLTSNWTNKDVKVTASTTSEYTKLGYRVQTSTNTTNWDDKADQTLSANGNVYARLVDSTGQYAEGSWATANVTNIDKQNPNKPTVTLKLANNNSNYNSGTWTNQNVNVTFTANDNGGSGVVSYEYSTDKTNNITSKTSPFTISAEGTTNIYIRAIDEATNKGAWSELKIVKKDTVAPTANLKGTVNGSTNVTLNGEGSDASGNISYGWSANKDTQPSSWTAANSKSINTSKAVTSTTCFWIKDEAGNTAYKLATLSKHTHSTSCNSRCIGKIEFRGNGVQEFCAICGAKVVDKYCTAGDYFGCTCPSCDHDLGTQCTKIKKCSQSENYVCTIN